VGTVVQIDRYRVREHLPQESKAVDDSIPLWLYPQVLSLDAPAVAVCWQWLFAKSFHVATSPLVPLLTGVSVWMIYVADHMLDVRDGAVYSARHRFVQRHRQSLTAIMALTATVAAIASLFLPIPILRGGIELAGIVLGYMAAVHVSRRKLLRYWPKELVIGLVFAAGASLATWTNSPAVAHAWPAILIFAAICTLNCAALDGWEWRSHRLISRYPHRLTRWIARHFSIAAIAALIAAAALLVRARNPVALALGASVLMMMGVARLRHRLSPDTLRLMFDATLLTPLFFLLR